MFKKKKATVARNNKPIMTAPRHERNGMWIYNFDEFENILSSHTETMNNIYEITKSKELVTCLHAAAGFPVVDTWVKAIRNGQFATWPGLTSALVYKNLPKSNETLKGYTKQQ